MRNATSNVKIRLTAASLLSLLALSPLATATHQPTRSLSKQERYRLMQMQDQEQREQREQQHQLVQPRRTTTVETRIVGGTAVPNKNKYPYFLEWEDAKCGASLVHDDIALSAAHCENDAHPFDTRVFMLGLKTAEGFPRYIESVTSHPLYSGGLQDYDFMMIKLSESALVDANGQPTGASLVNLNRNASLPLVGDALTGMGFGKLDEEDRDTSPDLMEVEIYYISNDVCMEQYGSADFVPELMFCAGIEGVGGQDTCQGDSGGPIMHQATNTQVGVVSFGIGCAQEKYAGVNARVEAVTEWIDEMICELSDMPPARCNAGNNPQATAPPPDVLPTGGKGAISVHVQYDDYPEETAWSLTYLDMPPGQEPLQIFLHPFAQQSSIKDREYKKETFTNLPAGTYSLQFGDQAKDGMCCAYGPGKVWATDDVSGTKFWENNGSYGAYWEVTFEIYPSGSLTKLAEDTDYENSWEGFTAVNHPPSFDPEWPGALPTADKNAVMINMKFDAFPEEVTWTFSEKGNGQNWRQLRKFVGATEGITNQRVSVEMDNLNQGWHRFEVTDVQGDGVCCNYRRGWASLTGPLVTTKTKGLIWGNNGEFGAGVTVYLLINGNGMVAQVKYTDPLETTTTTARSSLRKTTPGERRDLEQPAQSASKRHPLSLSTWTDLPKEGLKRLP